MPKIKWAPLVNIKILRHKTASRHNVIGSVFFLFELGLVPKGAINQEAPWAPGESAERGIFREQAFWDSSWWTPSRLLSPSEHRWLSTIWSMQGLPPFFPPGAYSGRDMDHPLGARSFSALTSEVAWWTGSTGTSPTVPFNLHLQQSLHKKL